MSISLLGMVADHTTPKMSEGGGIHAEQQRLQRSDGSCRIKGQQGQ